MVGRKGDPGEGEKCREVLRSSDREKENGGSIFFRPRRSKMGVLLSSESEDRRTLPHLNTPTNFFVLRLRRSKMAAVLRFSNVEDGGSSRNKGKESFVRLAPLRSDSSHLVTLGPSGSPCPPCLVYHV